MAHYSAGFQVLCLLDMAEDHPRKQLLDFLNLRSFLNVLPMDPSQLCLNMSRVNFCQTIEQLFRGFELFVPLCCRKLLERLPLKEM